LPAVVRDVAELYEPVAEEEGAELEAVEAGAGHLSANRELLGQALANLIDNAIKHGAAGRGGRPRVIVLSTARDGETLVLSVADNGVRAFPPADRERVLQRFVRLEKSRSQPGSGLGLSLVAAVVRLHNGTIELGDANPGLVVTIRLPMLCRSRERQAWRRSGDLLSAR
jgi:signal transduction histidine kinase